MTEKRERYIPWYIADEEMKKRKRREARGVPDEHEKHVKRGKAAKRKGKKGEDEYGKHVVKRIGGEAWIRRHDRDVQFHGNALAGHHSEVKRYAKFGMEKHCKQAEQDAATHGHMRWLVAWRPDGQTRWRISTDLDDYLADMQELKERRESDEDAER